MFRLSKYVALSWVLFLCSAAWAQIAIQSSDFNFPVGYKFIARISTAPFDYASFTSGSGGPQQWDFSTLQFNSAAETDVVDPSTAPQSSTFPTANYCMSTGTSWVYFVKTSSQVSDLGNVTEYPALTYTTTKYYAPAAILEFPTTMGTSWVTRRGSTSLSTSPGYDSLNVDDSIRYVCDAWGTAKYGFNSMGCLRLRESHTNMTTVWHSGSVLHKDTTRFEIVQFIGNTSVAGISISKTTSAGEDYYSASGDSRFVDQKTPVEESNTASLPQSFSLEQNSPNPFNPSTTIRYRLPRPADVSLEIVNALGEIAYERNCGLQPAGDHEIIWDVAEGRSALLPSGVYFYLLTAGEQTAVKKMVLLK